MCILFVTFSPQILPSQFNSTISLWKFEIFSSYPGTGTVLCKFYIYFKYTKSYFFKDYNYLQTDSFILFTASKQFMKDLYCGDTNLSKTSSFFKILLTSLPLKFPPWNTSLFTTIVRYASVKSPQVSSRECRILFTGPRSTRWRGGGGSEQEQVHLLDVLLMVQIYN